MLIMKPATVSIPRLVSKFVGTYDRLFAGYSIEQIAPHETPAQFWANLLALQVDAPHIGRHIRALSKAEVLSSHKSLLNTLFSTCLQHLRSAPRTDVRALHAAETMSVVVRCVMEKGLDGWEVMEAFAGGVGRSDEVFLGLARAIEDVLVDDEDAPLNLKRAVLHLALVFVSSIGQLSPGAYLLRLDLFPALARIVKCRQPARESESETGMRELRFGTVVLLSLLAGYHRTDAPRLNGYLRAVEEVEDRDFLRALAGTANYAMDGVVKAYQEIMDDSPPTFASSMGSLFASFRPDRALSATPVDAPKERFKNQPNEAAVILLAVHDFIHLNSVFNAILIEPLISPSTASVSPRLLANQNSEQERTIHSLLHTFLSLSSYIFTHASSAQSERAAAYASLCLSSALHLVENDVAMSALVQPAPSGSDAKVRICRQRLPLLPTGPSSRPLLCAILDCCVLWLRHNLHKRLEVQSYLTCVWIIYRSIWFLSRTRRRLDYHWEELWRSLILLLDFVSVKLPGTLKVEQLVQETIIVLDFSLTHAETFLGTPQAIHQLVYELVRSTAMLHRQHPVCQKKPAARRHAGNRFMMVTPAVSLRRLLDATAHYEEVIRESGAKSSSASAVLRSIAREVEREGVFGGREMNDEEAPKRSGELGEVGFVRFAYADVLTLMPGPDNG